MHRLFCAFLICVVASIGAASGKEVKAPASPTPSANATALLENARWYRDAKDYASAEKLILAALEAAPDDQLLRSQAKSLWEDVRKASQEKQTADEAATKTKAAEDLQKTRNKQAAELEEARRLSAQGKNEQASQTALSVLKETDDPKLVEEAKNILANNQPSAVGLIRVIPQRLFTIGGWVLDIALAIILVFLPLLLIRRVYSAYQRYSWRKAFEDWKFKKGSRNFFRFVKDSGVKYQWWFFRGVADTSQTGIAEAVIDSIKRLSEAQPTGYADLLLMERMKFEPVIFEFSEVHVDPLPALEALNLQIGGVTLGGIATALSTLQAWIGAKVLWIKGTAITADGMITVRLTRRNADDTSSSVTASGDKTKVGDLAETVTYMMFYSLSKSSALSDVEAANKLREGRELLGQYVSGQDPKQLEAAYDVFRNVRIERPTFNEVYLYEGIALDLLEQHDEAIKRFQYLRENSSDLDLRNKATYNEAVSLFRSYKPQAFIDSITILDRLIGLSPNWYQEPATFTAGMSALTSFPTKALALATKANVVAHKPIFWKFYCNVPKDLDEQTFLQHKAAAGTTIMDWVYEVGTISEQLKVILKRAKGDRWDDATRQELRWAIHNAFGNVYLNVASNFLLPPNIPGIHEPEQRLRYLKHAYEYFQECEMLLPPGVETLTNLATAVLALCREDKNYRYDQVRAYLARAKAANPHYEYADYRLAESWEQEGRIDEVVRVLRDFAKDRTPSIRSFKEFYSRYSLQLAKFPIEQPESSESQSPETDTPSTKPASQSA